MTMNACSHKHGCSGNYLLAWDVAQMSAVIPSIWLAYHSPRSVHIIIYIFVLFKSWERAPVDKCLIVFTVESNNIFWNFVRGK